jgi:hypothetical protein
LNAEGNILFKNPMVRVGTLIAACMAAILPFLRWGNPSGHDFEFHMFSWMEVLSQWKHGIAFPRWAASAHWGYGEARFLFYPPASWTLGAALGAVLPWKIVPATYCLIALTLAGAAMYRLAREWLPSSSALFAGIFFALNPYHLLIVYWRSAYAELLAAALLPLVPLFLLRIFSDEPRLRLRSLLGLSLTLAAAWLTNTPAAVMIHYSTAILAIVIVARHLFIERVSIARPFIARPFFERARSSPVWPFLAYTLLSISLGMALASFYLVPAFHEKGWVNLSQVLSPGVRPQDNFLFTTIADADHNHFNLFVSSVAVAEITLLVIAIWLSRSSQKAVSLALAAKSVKDSELTGQISEANAGIPWLLFSFSGAATVFLMVNTSDLFWRLLPELRYVQLPFRWLLCLNTVLAILMTVALKRWPWRLLACGLLLATLICAGRIFQPPWWATSADIREMSDAIADGRGYEGTDEYVPIDADPYELNKNLPRVSNDEGKSVPSDILRWSETEKRFKVRATAAQDLTIRLFDYPAWKVVVNGLPAETQKTDVTGLLVIPVFAGDNDIQIKFRRTWDRLTGNIVSVVSLGVFFFLSMKTRKSKTSRSSSLSGT